MNVNRNEPWVNRGGGLRTETTYRNNRVALRRLENASENKLSKSIADGDANKFVRLARTTKFNKLHGNAYKARQGYSIGKINNEKVLYVSGSRNKVDWALNAIGPLIPKKRKYVQKATARRLHRIAQENDVDVVVGHSRGGALVSAMPGGRYQKASVDGAMLIAVDKTIFNVAQNQPFDRLIGATGKNNHYVDPGKVKDWHYVMRP